MGRILVKYYLQERDQGATEEQWQVGGGFQHGIVDAFVGFTGLPFRARRGKHVPYRMTHV